MNFDRLIASRPVRIISALLALVFVGTVWAYLRERDSGAGPVWLLAAGVSGLAAAIGAIFSFRRVYDAWMRFAGVLHTVASTALFGLCYLLIVPFFAVIVRILDPLKLRTTGNESTFWVTRRQSEDDPVSYQRMG